MVSEHLTGAMLYACWTSIIWAPLVAGIAVWKARFRWIVASGVAIVMIALFLAQVVYRSFEPDCDTLPELEIFVCRERTVVWAILDLVMTGAALISSAIFLLGWFISRRYENRKVAH